MPEANMNDASINQLTQDSSIGIETTCDILSKIIENIEGPKPQAPAERGPPSTTPQPGLIPAALRLNTNIGIAMNHASRLNELLFGQENRLNRT